MKKRATKILIIVAAIILLFPIPLFASDGGTVRFQAILYSVTSYHALNGTLHGGYDTGTEIKILGITVYEYTTFDR